MSSYYEVEVESREKLTRNLQPDKFVGDEIAQIVHEVTKAAQIELINIVWFLGKLKTVH